MASIDDLQLSLGEVQGEICSLKDHGCADYQTQGPPTVLFVRFATRRESLARNCGQIELCSSADASKRFEET